jgi:4-amino-4-deoxy-L-arabinose transferase-like glycosyltransferase
MKIRVEIDFSWYRRRFTAAVHRNPWIFLFLAFLFAAHMIQIAFPSDGSMIFDEAHYVPASVATLDGIAANAEHPPLPKIIGAIGIALLGNNWFGWRFPQVLMQIAALYIFYLIARRLLGDPWALGATMLLGLDTVFFIHGGALLIDMPAFLFSFLAIELYFRKHYWLSAGSMGLAFLAREMSIFYFLALAVYHLGANWNWKSLKAMKPAFKLGVKYTFLALMIFGSTLWAYDLHYQPPMSTSVTNYVNANIVLGPNGTALTTVYMTIQSTSKDVIWNPIQHVEFIYRYHGPQGMNFINETYAPYLYAWNWVLPVDVASNLQVAFDPFNSPTYFRVDVTVSKGATVTHYIPIWYRAQANLALWYGIWPGIVGLAWAFKRRKQRLTALFLAVGIVGNFTPWLALSVLVRRIGFNYYMIYTLPFVALALAFMWKQLPERYGKKVLALNVIAALAFFLYFFPVHPMP